MKRQTLTPNVFVASVNETISWHKENLSFNSGMSDPEEGEMECALVQRDDVVLMF